MQVITSDSNLEKEINAPGRFLLVDFFATWCEPCTILGPILEKTSESFRDKVVFIKADLDSVPAAAQAFGVEKIPTVILFKDGKPISGFVGLAAENAIEEWLKKSTEMPEAEPAADGLIKEFGDYAKSNGFKLNSDTKTVDRIAKGLLANKSKYGQMYCPCRRVSGDKEEDAKKICPCFWHKEEIKKDGRCFCGLYVKNDKID